MRSSTSITLLFVTSAVTVFGLESWREEYANRKYLRTHPLSATQPFYGSGGYPYYHNSYYHHWWSFGSGWFGSGSSGSHSYSHASQSGTSRGGFGAHGHGSGS